VRVLLAYRVPASVESVVLSDAVVYRPDLEHKPPRDLLRALVALEPDALLVRVLPSQETLAHWRAVLGGRSPLVVQFDPGNGGIARSWELSGERLLATVEDVDPAALTHRVVPPRDEPELTAFLALEQAQRRASAQRRPRVELPGAPSRVALVGAGVVNLVTALELVEQGYEPVLYERAPDPRSDACWTAFGCTRGGGNARMFTLTECDNYNPKVACDVPNTIFRLPISQYGWSVCDGESLSDEEYRWIDEYESIPPWLAAAYNEDIFSFNHESGPLWDRLISDHPELFDDVELRPGILRLYTDPDQLEWSVTRQVRVGAFVDRLTPNQIAAKYPALADPCRSGVFAGGVEVVGFTVDAHRFLARLVTLLERHGVELRWETEVEAVVRDSDGRITGLRAGGEIVRADHYVVSPGAYGNGLLDGLASANRIHGVLGVWLTMPNVEPQLTHSLKITRRGHRAEDANVTVVKDAAGEDVLAYGSGYGHVGTDPRNIDPGELDALFAAVDENAQLFFPRAYEAAKESGLLIASQRWCVRPWTASALGVFELAPARGGGLFVVTGGHNTGGFSQSPSVAAAVVAALRGESHPMHELYRPERASQFLGASPPVVAAPRELVGAAA
jgi:glycine/D-amino acid oxidase-like deaminating enzyme